MKFTEEQLVVLDGIRPWVDFQYVEERKGRCQSYPVIHVLATDGYWCEGAGDMIPPPDELVGDWILSSTYDEEHTGWRDVRKDSYWERAEYKAVEVMEWRAV